MTVEEEADFAHDLRFQLKQLELPAADRTRKLMQRADGFTTAGIALHNIAFEPYHPAAG